MKESHCCREVLTNATVLPCASHVLVVRALPNTAKDCEKNTFFYGTSLPLKKVRRVFLNLCKSVGVCVGFISFILSQGFTAYVRGSH